MTLRPLIYLSLSFAGISFTQARTIHGRVFKTKD